MKFSSFVPARIERILDKALAGIRPDRQELLTLLTLNPCGPEADALRLTGKYITRRRTGTAGMLLCQTGMECFPCPADCAFCGFAQSTFTMKPWRISPERLAAINTMIRREAGVFAHFLLFMHTFDFAYMLRAVESTRAALPAGTTVVLNCGDLTRTQAAELKSAGASGAYHVLRLGEGRDTRLLPEDRIRTIDALLAAGLNWYTCCEPVGPEHSNEELADQILLAAERECFQNAVMRRIAVPGSTLAARGQISLLRSAQIVAVVTLAMVENARLSSIAIHEPDLSGLTAGANCVYAEFGANPRDREQETSRGRGHSPEDCRNMLHEAGYTEFMQADKFII